MRRALDTAYRATENVDRLVAAFEAQRPVRLATTDGTLTDAAASAPVVRVVNSIVTQALRDRASDVHIEPQDDEIRVRYPHRRRAARRARAAGRHRPGARSAASRSWRA